MADKSDGESRRDERERVQRISFQGMAATTSTLAALVVAITSAFTAIRAFALSESAASQRVFERQLEACVELNNVTTQADAANQFFVSSIVEASMTPGMEPPAAPGGAPAPAGAQPAAAPPADGRAVEQAMTSMRQRFDEAQTRAVALSSLSLRLRMLLPTEQAATHVDTGIERSADAYDLVSAEMESADGFTQADMQRASALWAQAGQEWQAATRICQQHVSAMARRGQVM